MKVKAQDLKPGMKCWTAIGSIVTLIEVHVFGEARSALVLPGKPQPYLPACILVRFKNAKGHEGAHTFNIDEEVERAFISE